MALIFKERSPWQKRHINGRFTINRNERSHIHNAAHDGAESNVIPGIGHAVRKLEEKRNDDKNLLQSAEHDVIEDQQSNDK